MAEASASRRVLVTGGGRGLGSAIVRAVAAAGHDVTFTYRSASAEADALVKELTAAYPGRAFAAHQADFADKAAANATVETTVQRLGRLDIHVNNAGVVNRAPFLDYGLEAWQTVLNVNLTGAFICGQAAARAMAAVLALAAAAAALAL